MTAERLAELITLFSRCRQKREVRNCEECGLLHPDFRDCPLKAQHDEYRDIELSGKVELKDAYPFLPADVLQELNIRLTRPDSGGEERLITC